MFKSIAQIFSMHVIVKIIGLLTLAIVLEFLSVEEFGKYSYYILFLHLVAIIIDPFTASYLVDYKVSLYKKYNLGIFLLSLLLLPFFYGVLFYFNFNLELNVFVFFCLTFIIGGALKSFFNVREEFFKYGLIDVFRQLSIFLSTLFYLYFTKEIHFLSLLQLNYSITFVMLLLLLPFYLKKDLVYFDIRIKTLKNLFYKSRFLIFYTAITPLFSFIDSWFIEKTLEEKDLGLYSFSLKVYNISLMLVVPMFTVLNIKQIEIAKKEGYHLFLKRNLKRVIYFAISLFLLFSSVNYIITHFLYLEYKASFISTSILLFGSFIAYLTIPFSFLIAYRKYKSLFLLAVISIIINIGINFFLIKKFGTTIAAISTAFSQLTINLGAALLSYFILNKKKV